MVRIAEVRKILVEGIPPFRMEIRDPEGNLIEEKEIDSYINVLESIKNAFGGSLRKTELSVEEASDETKMVITKSNGPRVTISFKRKKQLDLMSFFQ